MIETKRNICVLFQRYYFAMSRVKKVERSDVAVAIKSFFVLIFYRIYFAMISRDRHVYGACKQH